MHKHDCLSNSNNYDDGVSYLYNYYVIMIGPNKQFEHYSAVSSQKLTAIQKNLKFQNEHLSRKRYRAISSDDRSTDDVDDVMTGDERENNNDASDAKTSQKRQRLANLNEEETESKIQSSSADGKEKKVKIIKPDSKHNGKLFCLNFVIIPMA